MQFERRELASNYRPSVFTLYGYGRRETNCQCKVHSQVVKVADIQSARALSKLSVAKLKSHDCTQYFKDVSGTLSLARLQSTSIQGR